MKKLKSAFAILLILSILLLPLASAADWKFEKSKIHFYMYGMSTCPHCRHMKKLIPETYGYDRFTYYELNGNQHNGKVLTNISRLTGITGVPAIGIVYDGKLVGIIEGEYNVSATPEIVRIALQNNGTLLFVGGKTYLLPWNSTKSMETVNKLYYLFVKAGEPEKLPTTTSSEGGSGICGPGFVALAALTPMVFVRRKK
ncbi:glutaredoxin [Thermococcus profundus]|uniref:Glutaredoxin n=1 Tax=Thermococcus profundus TaxID=49899 RepID=A0A2Z2MFP0_THEPR|nr:glutaredoxin [Thermococcus profundus]ASJ02714.1 glutaredoxin [Thermococcus profundus]